MKNTGVNTGRFDRLSAVILCCFLLMFFAGLMVTGDYGIPTDERQELAILFGNVREYLDLYFDENSEIMYSLDMNKIGYISESIEKDHGQAGYYPMVPIFFLAARDAQGLGGHEISLIYHYYTYLLCFTAVVALYVLVKDLFKDRWLALLGACLLFVTPRFFAEIHYNNKDMVLLCLLVDTCCFGILATKYKKFRDIFLFALFAALTANTKIIGLYFFAVIGMTYIIFTTINKDWNKNSLTAMGLAVVLFCAIYYLITPAMWRSPLEFFDYSLFNAFNFSRWHGTVLFEGQFLNPVNRELPVRYIMKLISVTTPVFILILSVLGAIRSIFETAKAESRKANAEVLLFVLMICICTLLPMLISSVKKSIVYNGWRHFYFSYFGIVMLAVFGMDRLVKHNRKITVLLVAGFILFNSVQTVLNHPYQFVYFNCFAGKDAGQRYETDYWGVSTADAIKLVLDDSEGQETTKISWCGDDLSRLLLINAYNALPEEDAKRVDLVYEAAEAEYMIVNVNSAMKYGGTSYDDFQHFASIEAYGNELTRIYKQG